MNDDKVVTSYADLLADNDCIQCGAATEFDHIANGFYELCNDCQKDQCTPEQNAAGDVWESLTPEERQQLFNALQAEAEKCEGAN
jgi:hypothetical protein